MKTTKSPAAAVSAIPAGATAHPGLMAPEWAVRAELPVDIDQIHELHRTSFSRPAEAELVDAVRASAGFIPQLSLVAATADGSVLGHVLISRVELQRDEESTAVLALAPVAVLPAHRDRGIGSTLVAGALAMAEERDEPFVVVLGSPRFFARFGFLPAAGFGVTGPYDVPDDVYQIYPQPATEIPGGRVVYPPSFAGV